MPTPRRSFLGRLAALLAVGAAPSTLAAATREAEREAPWPDERWLEQMANREHRILCESGVIADGLVLRRGLNFIDVMNADYSITDDRLGVALGFHSPALGFALNDAMWSKYALGAKWDVKTPQGAPATANPFKAGAPFSAESLQKRGVHLLACNRALIRLSRELAGTSGNSQAVHAELVANVLPGVIVVPAMIAAVARAQAKGVPYMAVV